MESIPQYFKVSNISKIYSPNALSTQVIDLINQPKPVEQYKASLNFMNVHYISKFISSFSINLDQLSKNKTDLISTLNKELKEQNTSTYFEVEESSKKSPLYSIDINNLASGESHTGSFLILNNNYELSNSYLEVESLNSYYKIDFKDKLYNDSFEYLSDISESINSKAPMFSATIQEKENSYALNITNKETGSNSNFVVKGSLASELGIDSKDAFIINGSDSNAKINNEYVTSKSNTVDLLSGMKIKLKNITKKPIEIDAQLINNKISNFIKSYNNLLNQASTFSKDSNITSIEKISVMLSSLYDDTLNEFGISNSDNRLKFDNSPKYIDLNSTNDFKNYINQYDSYIENIEIDPINIVKEFLNEDIHLTTLYSNQAHTSYLNPFLGFGLYIDLDI